MTTDSARLRIPPRDHPNELTSERVSDRLPETRLAHAGGPRKQRIGPFPWD